MNSYQKSISYLDYLENGMKIRNAGFVKLEERNGQMRMEVRVKDLPEMFSGQYDLYADSSDVIGAISLNRGNGSCCIVWNMEESGKREGAEAGGIYLRLPDRCLVQTVWPTPVRIPIRQAKELSESAAEMLSSKEEEPEKLLDLLAIQSGKTEDEKLESEEHSETAEKENMPQDTGQQEQYYSDKWEQLSHIYPQIHPFDDERTYLSISPKDFIVLCREYQKMVHNSFLLHGFYNYHHLLLGKIEEKGERHYYLGVPGNFYTREKMVAEMFGFEAFEGNKNPASPGDFGYYMKRVEI